MKRKIKEKQIMKKNPLTYPSPEAQLFNLGMMAQRFYQLYGDMIASCVHVSTEILRFLNVNHILMDASVVRRIIKTKSHIQEHSWVEVIINKKTHVIDITGKKQFGLSHIFYNNPEEYMKELIRCIDGPVKCRRKR